MGNHQCFFCVQPPSDDTDETTLLAHQDERNALQIILPHNRQEKETEVNHTRKGLRESLIREHRHHAIEDYYNITEVVGVGSIGSVVSARRKKKNSPSPNNPTKGKDGNQNNLFDLKQLTTTGLMKNENSFRFNSSESSSLVSHKQNSDETTHERLIEVLCSDNTAPTAPTAPHTLSSSTLGTMSTMTLTGCGNKKGGGNTIHSVYNYSSKYETEYAIKSIKTDNHSSSRRRLPFHSLRNRRKLLGQNSPLCELQNEINILKTLDHPNIIKPFEIIQRSRYELNVVMELCQGGDLYSRDPYTEQEAAVIVHDMLLAINYMHGMDVVHRDLKYENVMFATTSPTSRIKLIDFGLSKRHLPDESPMSDGVGTIYTMAPQVLNGSYTSQADLWSIGVLAFMLLSSQKPFYGKSKSNVALKIMKCQYDFKHERWNHVSRDAKSFVSSLLQIDPNLRPNAKEALNSPWITKHSKESKFEDHDEVMTNVRESIEKFVSYSKLKRLILMVIAHGLTTDDVGILRDVFDRFDCQSKDGKIDFEDFVHTMKVYGYELGALQDMFDSMDFDGSGSIHYTEFLASTIEAIWGHINEEEHIESAFEMLRTDGLTYISQMTLNNFLAGTLLSDDYKKEIFDDMSFFGGEDGYVHLEDFLKWYHKKDESEKDDKKKSLYI